MSLWGRLRAQKLLDKAVKDGWVPGKNALPIEEAAQRGTIIQYLVSDAAQMMLWPKVKEKLKKGDALYFRMVFPSYIKNRPALFRRWMWM